MRETYVTRMLVVLPALPPPSEPSPEYWYHPPDESLNPYIAVIENWKIGHLNSLLPVTPLDCVEHHLFRLFFFDAVKALPYLSSNRLPDPLRDLKKKADYVVLSLLHPFRDWVQLGEVKFEETRQEQSATSQQQDLLEDEKVPLEIADSAHTARIDGTIPRNSSKQLSSSRTLPPRSWRAFCSSWTPQ
ncbi:hypothetical protein HK102_006602 [Quaeritorhiza haematococci]|nr:hypothetical protein HK102_006602 [Quaeritorhiza haematococci]